MDTHVPQTVLPSDSVVTLPGARVITLPCRRDGSSTRLLKTLLAIAERLAAQSPQPMVQSDQNRQA